MSGIKGKGIVVAPGIGHAIAACDILLPRMQSGPDWIFFAIAAVSVLYVLKAIRLSRESLHPIFKRFAIGFLIGLLYYVQWGKPTGDKPINNGIFFGVVTAAVFHQKRRRYYSRKLRDQVITRHFKDRKHEYDTKKHHIDHKVAFAKGGSHTLDNLRIMDRTKNPKKGAKWPSLWDMFFR
jgi:hypothetical protein